MVFVDRKAKYPGRWTMIKSDGTSEVVTLVRNDEPEVEGTPMNAETLNTLSDVAGADIARQQAEAAQEAAAGSATEAAGSARAAEESKTAAATSEANAAKHEKAAKKAAEEAGAKAGTDKTLSIANAPADAKATGDALAEKVDNDVILDEDGNVIFYSKAAVDELLAGKLGLHDAADNGVVASGDNYVRFGDGTQICTMELAVQNIAQGGTYEANNVTFPVPFSTVPTMSTGSSWGWGEDAFFVGISYADFNIRILNCSSNQHSRHVIAIGRWK